MLPKTVLQRIGYWIADPKTWQSYTTVNRLTYIATKALIKTKQWEFSKERVWEEEDHPGYFKCAERAMPNRESIAGTGVISYTEVHPMRFGSHISEYFSFSFPDAWLFVQNNIIFLPKEKTYKTLKACVRNRERSVQQFSICFKDIYLQLTVAEFSREFIIIKNNCQIVCEGRF